MSWPTRCNKRSCRTRKTLTKHPDEYVRIKTCHMPGCKGILKVDNYRQTAKNDPAIRTKDRGGEVCHDGLCLYHYPHNTMSEHCINRTDVLLEKIFNPVKPFTGGHTLEDDAPF